MIQVFDKLENFIAPNTTEDKRANRYGDFAERYFTLNDFVQSKSLSILTKREFAITSIKEEARSNNTISDFLLSQNVFIRDLNRMFNMTFKVTSQSKYSNLYTDSIKKVFGLLLHVFNANGTVSAYEQMFALKTLVYLMQNRNIYQLTNLIPVDDATDLLEPIKASGLTLEDFTGLNLLEKKRTHANLCHSFEPFMLMKEQINKLEDGLFDRISNSINVILNTNTHVDFIKSSLILIGLVEPFLVVKEGRQIHRHGLFEDVDLETTIDNQSTVSQEPDNKVSLMAKYQLDCHCHSQANDWRESIIPLLMNQILQMEAK